MISLVQIRAIGIPADAVDNRVRAGRLHSVHRGVYAVGHAGLTREARFLAAVLAVGEGAVLSHVAAAVLWGLRRPDGDDGGEVDVTVARRVRQRPGIRVHTVRVLAREETTRRTGIPVTTPARTLLDYSDLPLADRALRRYVHEAEVQRLVNDHQLRMQLDRARCGRHGAGRLAAIVDEGPAPTRSELEDRTLELLRCHGLMRPQTNVRVQGAEVDVRFGDLKLIVEVDGAATTRPAWRARPMPASRRGWRRPASASCA